MVFKDVVMRYRHDIDPALQNISFKVLPREKVGIIGRTGAGKLYYYECYYNNYYYYFYYYNWLKD